jgi:hypothetical protein
MKIQNLVQIVASMLFVIINIEVSYASSAFCNKASSDIGIISITADNALSSSTNDNTTTQIITKERSDILSAAFNECGQGNIIYIPSKFSGLVGTICDFSKSIITYPADGSPLSSEISAITMCVVRDEEQVK